jgi:surface protein
MSELVEKTQITNENIRQLVNNYIINKSKLPSDLQDIPIGKWDVSQVTNMNQLFYDFNEFNEPLNEWNVSNVTNMQYMFSYCDSFNQPLNEWNVSNVTNMAFMFSYCDSFNQPLNEWNVSNVTNMAFMFSHCDIFNQPLNEWNVSNVTNMTFMFSHCDIFNQPLNEWNVSNVTNMARMFDGCESFNQPLNDWNVANVTNMLKMFRNCESFNQPLTNWNVANVANVTNIYLDIFDNCRILVENTPRFRVTRRPPPPPRVDPNEVHRVAGKIPYELLNQFFITSNNNVNVPPPANFATYINETLSAFIEQSDQSEEVKQTQRDGLKAIMDQRLTGLDYSNQAPIVRSTLVNALEYVKRQPTKFQQQYVEAFVHDCVNAYDGANGMTCAAGALERILMSLQPASISDDSNEEHQKMLEILLANPQALVPDFIRKWFKSHEKGTSGEFPVETTIEEKRKSLMDYLLSKFPTQAVLIDEKIAEFRDDMLEEDDFILLFGGRRRRRRKTRKTKGGKLRRITRRKRPRRRTPKKK